MNLEKSFHFLTLHRYKSFSFFHRHFFYQVQWFLMTKFSFPCDFTFFSFFGSFSRQLQMKCQNVQVKGKNKIQFQGKLDQCLVAIQ